MYRGRKQGRTGLVRLYTGAKPWCPHGPGVLRADPSVRGARLYPFLAPGHHVPTVLLAITISPSFGHVFAFELKSWALFKAVPQGLSAVVLNEGAQ